MRNVVAATDTSRKISRPLKVLVPLIRDEIDAGNEAGLEHYRRAGAMLIEAKRQVPYGAWSRWLTKNFELSQTTAQRYIRLADKVESGEITLTTRGESGPGLTSLIGERPARHAYKNFFKAADRVNVTRLADERQSREREIVLHRETALKLLDLGYRAMAALVHPDRPGGSREAMQRLNTVRDQLKDIAATRRFI